MGAMDVVLNTSYREGTPVALIEAAAAGRAIVATDVGGTRQVVRDGETGILVASGDDVGTAEALSDLIGDEALRWRLGSAARADVLKRFDIAATLRSTAAVYRQVLAEE